VRLWVKRAARICFVVCRNNNFLPFGFTGVLAEIKGRGGRLAAAGEVAHFNSMGKRTVIGKTYESGKEGAKPRENDWDNLIVVAQGPRLCHWLNGQLVVDVTDEDCKHSACKGMLALQLHAGRPMVVQCKDLWLKDISPCRQEEIAKCFNFWDSIKKENYYVFTSAR